ncbi:MAG: response regulator transcription factor, partial [Rubrivivax sp.]|nr:response regulator transcription factor [Rubrivivax sp.]
MNTGPGPPAVRLLLVDDHTIVREGLKRVLEGTGEGWDITEEGSGFQALDSLRRARFDLAIVDLSMPGMSGLELIRRIRVEFPPLPVLVLSMHAEEEYALRAFKAGANGYVTKDSAAEELVLAVHKVLRGGAYVTTTLAERVVQQLNGSVDVPRHAQLSNRELEVLRRIVAGQRSTDIANALHLSVKTISTHKTRIMEKLQLTSTAALVRYAMERRLHGEDPPAAWPDDPADWPA